MTETPALPLRYIRDVAVEIIEQLMKLNSKHVP